MGASIGAALAEWLRLDKMDLHTLLAAGAAAGLAAAFNAPLAAVLFVIEETRKQFHYTFRSYVAVIVASAGSAFGMELVGGTAPPLRIDTDALPLVLLPTFMVLGVVLGVLGVAFNKTPGDGAGLARQGLRARARSSTPSSSAPRSACWPSSCRWRSAAARR